MILNEKFVNKHKKKFSYFTRKRKLSFKTVIIAILRKSVRSIQNSLNELFDKMQSKLDTPSKSAFSQARKKLSYTAFIEMNENGILNNFYSDNKVKKYKGYLLRAIDGSVIKVPNNVGTEKHFGVTKVNNQHHEENSVYSKVSVMYDILNNLAIHSEIENMKYGERYLAKKHIEKCFEKQIIIMDRGYSSYELFDFIESKNQKYICRLQKNHRKNIVKSMKKNQKSIIFEMDKPRNYKPICKSLKARIIKVELETETEILITNLLDENEFSDNEFKDLYWKRWGIETYYDRIKNRFDLEHFTGTTVESIKQDFYSTIFISNLETILTNDTNKKLRKKSEKHKYPKKVNSNIAINTIKRNILNILFSEEIDLDTQLEKIKKEFEKAPTAIRKCRKYKRNATISQKLNHYKRNKKYTF